MGIVTHSHTLCDYTHKLSPAGSISCHWTPQFKPIEEKRVSGDWQDFGSIRCRKVLHLKLDLERGDGDSATLQWIMERLPKSGEDEGTVLVTLLCLVEAGVG